MVGLLMFIIMFVAIFGGCYLTYVIIEWYNKTFKKDCFKCKHWYLHNVPSFGDGHEYRCKKKDCGTNPPMITGYHWYVKCKEFEKE